MLNPKKLWLNLAVFGNRGNSAGMSKEVITFKKETRIKRGGDVSGSNDKSNSLSKNSLRGLGNEESNSGGKFSRIKQTVAETSGGKKVVTGTQMKVESGGSPKDGKTSRITKAKETTTISVTNQPGENDRGKKGTTITTTTKTTSTNQRSGQKVTQTTTTTNTKNDGAAGRSRSRGDNKPNQDSTGRRGQKTTTTTTTTTTTNQKNQPSTSGRRTREETKTTTSTTN